LQYEKICHTEKSLNFDVPISANIFLGYRIYKRIYMGGDSYKTNGDMFKYNNHYAKSLYTYRLNNDTTTETIGRESKDILGKHRPDWKCRSVDSLNSRIG